MIKKTDPDIVKGYLEDSSNLSGGHADGIYLPENKSEIITTVKECNDQKIPLTISAGATGTTGGCIPFGGWVMATQKLNKIVEVNKTGKFAIVQPGVTLEEIEKAVSNEGLLYPPDPTEKTATIGGNVATNASGGRGYRFGSTRNWIRRLKIVLPSGDVLNLKRGEYSANQSGLISIPQSVLRIPHYKMPQVKNSAGYYSKPNMDLIDLFIGSEGTLGIISEIEIALRPALAETFDVVAFFPAETLAVDFVIAAKQQQDSTINFFEFFDTNTLQMLKKSYPNIPTNAKAAVYIEQEITEQNEATYLDGWALLLEKFQVAIDNCWLGTNTKQKEELRKFRYAIPEHINELFKQHKIIKLATDIAVPDENFKEMYNYYNSALQTPHSALFHIKFGHIGENHLHVNLLPKTEEEKAQAKSIVLQYIRKAISLGGTISAEHGVGKIKHAYLQEMYGQHGIVEMQAIKKSIDPYYILGRNNMFPAPKKA